MAGVLKVSSHYFEMGNMQFNLDKTFDSIPVKNIASAKDIVAAIGKVEDKVSWNFKLISCVVSRRTGRHVSEHPRQLAQENEKSSASDGAKVRLGQANEYH